MTLILLFAVMQGIMLVLFPFFQAVLGWSALKSAIALMPMALFMMPATVLAPRLVEKLGSRLTMLTGRLISGTGVITLALRASVEGGYLSVLPGLLLIGLGLGCTMTPSTAVITESLPPEKQGVASALNDTTRQFGGSLGIALLGAVVTASYRDAMATTVEGLPDTIAEPASEGIGTAYGVVESLGLDGETAGRIIDGAQHAFVDAWVSAMWAGIGLIGVAFVFVLVRGPERGRVKAIDLHEELEPEPAI